MNSSFPHPQDEAVMAFAAAGSGKEGGSDQKPARSDDKDVSARPGAGEDPQKRRQILAGARAVFGDVGFDSASMSDVTRAAGVSKSTLYVYFRSKEELFTALIADERESYFERIEKIFSDPLHPAETLKTYGILVVTKLTSTKVVKACRTVIAVADRMPEVGRDFYKEGPERGIRLLAGYLSTAQQAGALVVPDPQRAAVQFVELAMAGLYRPRLFNHVATEPSADEIETTVDAAVTLFMAGYGARQEAASRT